MFRLSASKQLTPDMIEKYIEKNRSNEARKQKLINYYKGKQAICNRTMEDASKPNNKVASPYGHYITDIMTGYFMGEPITYNSDNEDMLENIKAIFNYNDEASENSELAQCASICGEAYEMLYLDEDKNIRFKNLGALGCIPIYDNTVEEELLYFIRYYEDEDIVTGAITRYIEVYSRNDIVLYEQNVGEMRLMDIKPHQFGLVPIIVYKNNEECIGDFELVISLIDAYDKTQSDSVNDLEYFEDAYLVLSGMMGTEAEDIRAMKENRVMLLDNDANAEWLTKSINDTYLENLKSRIEEDIHKFSSCPNMTDSEFSANASGVAIKYKVMGLENTTSKKERAFKKGIQRRLELICNMLYILGYNYSYMDIEINFKRNLPSNLTESADVIGKVGHLLSAETQINLLPLDIDAKKEIEQKRKEDTMGYDEGFGDMSE